MAVGIKARATIQFRKADEQCLAYLTLVKEHNYGEAIGIHLRIICRIFWPKTINNKDL